MAENLIFPVKCKGCNKILKNKNYSYKGYCYDCSHKDDDPNYIDILDLPDTLRIGVPRPGEWNIKNGRE